MALTVAAPLPLPVPVPPIIVEGGGIEAVFGTGTGEVEGDGMAVEERGVVVEKRLTLGDPETKEVRVRVGDPQPNV